MWPPWLVDDRLEAWFGLSWPLVEQLADAGRTGRNDVAINARIATNFIFEPFVEAVAILRRRRETERALNNSGP